MNNKNSSILVAAVATLLCFVSVFYFSCTKKNSNPRCTGIVCLNQGYCDTLGVCVCPAGYEGKTCGTASVSKYINTWDVRSTIIHSSDSSANGTDSNYVVYIAATATPTTFFIRNFYGNWEYNNVVCIIDTGRSDSFFFDISQQDFHMFNDKFSINPGSGGTIAPSDSLINITLYDQHPTKSLAMRYDTVALKLTPHHF
jgi:EGF-like domain